jgi:hypothetical protein
MLVNSYGWYNFTEEQIEQEYRKLYPMSGWMVDHLFQEQNPNVWRIAHFLNHFLGGYRAVKTKQLLTEQMIEHMCDQWWSAMISIHSRLWYPHWVVLNSYHRDAQGQMYVQFLNPSSTLTDDKWDRVLYRSRRVSRKAITIWDKPVINTILFKDFVTLHRNTLAFNSWPVSAVTNPGYIMVVKR